MKERIKKVLKHTSIILILGLGYAGICNVTGFGIPCMFRVITGYQCPACGVTHMFLALLKLQIRQAFQYNAVLFSLMPIFVIAVTYHVRQYVKNGKLEIKNLENIGCYIIIAILVIWGIVRNISI